MDTDKLNKNNDRRKLCSGILDKLWNRFSIRTKITFLTASVFIFISVISLVFTIQNVETIFIIDESAYSEITQGEGDSEHIPVDLDLQRALKRGQDMFRLTSTLMMAFLVIAGTLLIWWVSGKALKPLQKLSRIIKHLDINQLDQQIQVVESLDEVGDLQTAFNYMLVNIKESYEKQRRFSRNAAHELKTPVAAIRANLEVLNMDENPSYEDYRSFTDIVGRQTEAMASIVQGLRLLSSGENLNITKFNLYENIQMIILNLDNEIKKKNIKIHIKCADKNLHINADNVLMKQAIFNIIHNAIRYSDENGDIDISINTDSVIVKDYGSGISKENLARIFEPFYCVDSSRSKKLGGSGLGLAITKEILAEHGFNIKVKSEEGHFTEFEIDFQQSS
ncbi:sensor histidine kinase [Johnsonella ignava]|uniref:sensor histidine kinase n=1 Tax=Johnsonella ignava TaxID=43995 RepID=UPI0023F1BC9E|nr:HAMP domain-containing sensor histidine kinase [Johnsonella ignava]